MTDTLSFCGREEAITRMNCFGSEGRPFFFLIDYIAEKCLVEEPHRLPSSELLFAFRTCRKECPSLRIPALFVGSLVR